MLAHAYTNTYLQIISCVGWNATVIRDNGQTGKAMLSHQERREGGKMGHESEKERQRQKERKKEREGKGRNSQLISSRQKIGNE